MHKISDTQLINQLKESSSEGLEWLYKYYFPSVKGFIMQNSGTNEDAEDIFQESVLILLMKVNDNAFYLSSSLKTYLFAISRNLWLKKLRDRKIPDAQFANDLVIDELQEPDWKRRESDSTKLIEWLKKITLNCQRILTSIFLLNKPMEQLMVQMGWKNRHVADNQKYKCLQKVRKVAMYDKGE